MHILISGYMMIDLTVRDVLSICHTYAICLLAIGEVSVGK